MYPTTLPKEEDLSAAILLEVSRHGGHVGFIEGNLFRPRAWHEQRIVEWLDLYLHQDLDRR